MTSQTPQLSSMRNLALWTLLTAAFVSAIFYLTFMAVQYEWRWEAIWSQRVMIFKGWGFTLLISASALILTVILAISLMAGQRTRWLPVKMLSMGITELIRGTPLLVLLLLGYYGVANALQIHSPLIVGIFLLALFEAAYLAEIFRGAVESVSATQLEAARSVGFDSTQTWKHVIIPQAFRRALPGTAGQMVSLIKDSSLLTVIGVEELTQSVRAANAGAFTALEGYIPLAIMYLLLTLPLSAWSRHLEAKFKFDT